MLSTDKDKGMRLPSICLIMGITLLSAAPGTAQDAPADGDSVPPLNLYPHGQSEAVAMAMMAQLQIVQQARNRCEKYGCLVIVNEAPGYDVIGFYLQDRKGPGGTRRWGYNQFDRPLSAMKATVAFKRDDASVCSVPIRFVMRDRKSKQRLSIDGVTSMCGPPPKDSLIRLKLQRPTVTVLPVDGN